MADTVKVVSGGSGIGALGILGIILVVLKVLGKISISWWWALAPFWIPSVIALFIFLVLMFIAVFVALVS